MKKRLEIIVTGKVQGVFFRQTICEMAQKFQIAGTVSNKPDGSVAIVAEGHEDNLRKLLKFCYNGVQGATVEDVQYSWYEIKNEFGGFQIL